MKTEVYSWRLSAEVKADLEREARVRRMPVSAILDAAVRDWLGRSATSAAEQEAQRELHAAAAPYLGVLASGNPRRAENARKAIHARLRSRHAR